MTKQLTTPCFIRKNTPELRDKLYRLDRRHFMREVCLFDYLFTIENMWSSFGKDFVDQLGHEYVDCGENEQLFLTLAAMNDSDDKDQWFTDGIHWVLCEHYSWIDSVVRSKHNDYGYTDTLDKYRKATVPEIIEHFKTKEK